MQSIREIYKIGRGPSSSHTMGPEKAAKVFLEKYKNAESYKVILYGSLAKTGKGHHTDLAINSVLGAERTEIVFDTETVGLPHENTMDFFRIFRRRRDRIYARAQRRRRGHFG